MEKFLIFNLIVLLSHSLASTEIENELNVFNGTKSRLLERVTKLSGIEDLPISSIDQITKFAKEMCIKETGNSDGFDDTSFKKCANEFGSIDMSIVTDEVEKGIKNGNLDVVFSKYCNKRSEALECLNEFEKMIEPCLNQKDRDFKNVFVNIAKNLLEFVCYDNGSEMAQFFTGGGPDCVVSKQEELTKCFEEAMSKYNENVVESLQSLIIKPEFCQDMDNFKDCTVIKLESCKESLKNQADDLVKGLYQIVRKEMPCAKDKRNSAESAKISVGLLTETLLMAFAARMIGSSN